MSSALVKEYAMELVESAVAMAGLKVLSLDDKIMSTFNDGSVPMQSASLGLIYFLGSDVVDYVFDSKSKILEMDYMAAGNDILYFSLGNLVFGMTPADAMLGGLIQQIPGNLSYGTQVVLAAGAKLAALRIIGKTIEKIPGGFSDNPIKGARFPASWLKTIIDK